MTIVAPATPQGRSAIAAVRISGSASTVSQIVFGLLGRSALAPRMMTLCNARDPRDGRVLDSLLAVHFPGPASYTGEDVLELFPHGNPLLVRDLVNAALTIPGVRLAEPGEFTRRALEHGRMDLLQAESVGAIAHAESERALRNAQRLAAGGLSPRIRDLAAQVKRVSALVELDVDFAEEEANPEPGRWTAMLQDVERALADLQDGYRQASVRERVPSVALYGPPNAGKSSLVNALLREDRVLVSSIAGTTRDSVEVRLLLAGGEVRLVDTAGLGTARDELDAMAQERSRKVLQQADLRVLVMPFDADASSEDGTQPDIVVLSQCDRDTSATTSGNDAAHIRTSAHTGAGLTALMEAMSARLFRDVAEEEPWLTGERQARCVMDALAAVQRAQAISASPRPAVELLAHELQMARRALGSITGEIVAEDVLQAIFAGFCIGK